MSRRVGSIDPSYFETLYRGSPDPWAFETSDYERAKYAATLAACAPFNQGRVLEVGCSIGIFTAALARTAETVLALDVSDVALDLARRRCAGLANVTLENRRIPASFPAGAFDLIVMSEVLYYLDAADLAAAADGSLDRLAEGGAIVACHWLGETDYPLSGMDASDRFAALIARRLPVRTLLHDETYRLERFEQAIVGPSASRG